MDGSPTPLHLLQESLSRYQDVREILDDFAIMFDENLPPPSLFLPICSHNAVIILDISVKVPFFRGIFHILPDLLPSGVELGPLGVWIKGKCLKISCRNEPGVVDNSRRCEKGRRIRLQDMY